MKVALIGQSTFGARVYEELIAKGHEVVGVFTIPDKDGKVDPLAEVAENNGARVFKIPRWKALKKDGGQTIPEVMDLYYSVGAELNVLAFVTQFIPMEVIDGSKHGSIVYHPSILPRHRGASAINWTLMEGDAKAGFTIFWADDGLDTGPILLIREVDVEEEDTVDTLYMRFLFPEGVKALAEAVQMIEDGSAPRITQPEEGASYDQMWKKKDLAKVSWDKTGRQLHNFIRGNDKVPGAWTDINGDQVTFYGSRMLQEGEGSDGEALTIDGCDRPAAVISDGLVLTGSDGARVLVRMVKVGSRTMPASKLLGGGDDASALQLTEEEEGMKEAIRGVWASILAADTVADDIDFFAAGAASMDVTRLLATLEQSCAVSLTADDVYMNTVFAEFVAAVVTAKRGAAAGDDWNKVEIRANDMDVVFPNQLFIDGKFVDAIGGKTFATVNPATEEEICQVAEGTEEDVEVAVKAAQAAFVNPRWRRMNARDRGALMYRLADEMEAAKEELATLESLDSGAVYTLALKTHVGMSIDTFRYFAGCCDKICGRTIPINNARPNYNLCFTKKEPIGVCGLVVPWNYPLMMLAWKMAACLAAGNCVVMKPAKVTPLTALKFAELTVRAGFPPGVINILPGSGTRVGNAIARHHAVRKLGFTGSTGVGHTIMQSAAESNLKKVSLELGGKSPLIIFADSDMDKAVRTAMSACFFNKGENCIAAGRLFVEDSIHDEFVRRVNEETGKMKIGDPLDRSTDHGPQNHRAHFESLLRFIERGKAEGATLVRGGERVGTTGLYLQPTIFTDVTDEMWMAEEESFGPIMIISRFDGDVEKVLERANATEYGLASGVFTRDISKALRVADGLHAGTCYVNTYNKTDVAAPFGGVKKSGFGKDLGVEALEEYLTTKTITVEY